MRPPLYGHFDALTEEQPLDASYLRGHPERGTMARQEDRDEVDINTITARFGLTGQLPPRRTPVYGIALDDDADLHTTYVMRADAQRAFMELPADTRRKYGNWMKMLDAIHAGELKLYEITGDEPPKEAPAPAPAPAPTGDEA